MPVIQDLPFLRPGLADLVDIGLVAYLIYRVFLLIRGTRAAQMLFGFVVLVVLAFVADLAHLGVLEVILSSLTTVWVIAFIVVFQPELRTALAQLGQNPFFRFFVKVEEHRLLDEIVAAVRELAQAKLGALIVLEQEVGLVSYAETGTRIQAKASAELLHTIFSPYSPLHDGAVIIRGEMIVAAGCILPLTQFPIYGKLGTRHRAALGLSEETDAVVVVVSEETQAISVAYTGVLERDLEPDELKERLARLVKIPET